MAQVATGPLSRQWVEAADSGVGPIADFAATARPGHLTPDTRSRD
jgi:hypothetical protein